MIEHPDRSIETQVDAMLMFLEGIRSGLRQCRRELERPDPTNP